MTHTRATFGSRKDADLAVQALLSGHFPDEDIGLTSAVDGVMRPVVMEYQWWASAGMLLGAVFGGGLALAAWGSADRALAILGPWVPLFCGVLGGTFAGGLGGLGTWRMRFARELSSSYRYVVAVRVSEGRRSEAGRLLAQHGGAPLRASA